MLATGRSQAARVLICVGTVMLVGMLAASRIMLAFAIPPLAIIMAVANLEALEETLDLLSTTGALEQIRQAETAIADGEAVDADGLRTLMIARAGRESRG